MRAVREVTKANAVVGGMGQGVALWLDFRWAWEEEGTLVLSTLTDESRWVVMMRGAGRSHFLQNGRLLIEGVAVLLLENK